MPSSRPVNPSFSVVVAFMDMLFRAAGVCSNKAIVPADLYVLLSTAKNLPE